MNSPKKKLTASMTVEAAVLVPLFLCACYILSFAFDAVRVYGDTQMELMKMGKTMALAECISGGTVEEDIRLERTTRIKPDWSLISSEGLTIRNNYYTRAFNGYDLSSINSSTVTVFVALNGEVYHLRRDCSYIKLSVREVSRLSLDSLTNTDGKKYDLCRYCGKEEGENCFITDYGEFAHFKRDCPVIKRSIFSLTLEQAEKEFRRCSRCGAQ